MHGFGWRGACLVWAATNLLIACPLYRFVVPRALPLRSEGTKTTQSPLAEGALREGTLLAVMFGAVTFVSGAMSAHFPRLLLAAGVVPSAAIFAAAMIGPAQVAARLLEFALLRRISPLISARVATVLQPVGAAAFCFLGAPSIVLAVFYGAGNGMLTIARGTLPLAVFGAQNYGLLTGMLAAPARVTLALAPFAFGVILDRLGVSVALGVASAASVVATLAVFALRPLKVTPKPRDREA
jgi:hypothetical protein